MKEILKKIDEAFFFIANAVKMRPKTAIILGTGLGHLAEHLHPEISIPFERLPYFPRCTTESHAGRLIWGQWADQNVLVMQGRFHLYEGYHPAEITFPIRIMRRLNIHTLIITNAAGGLNPSFVVGDVMLITDHINLMGQNPLVGPNLEGFGPRFPAMGNAYDRKLIGIAEKVAEKVGIRLQKGVYAGVIGPSLETKAEIRFLRSIGADAVGMSTIPEVIVAVHCGFKILGFSAISNMNLPEDMQPCSFDEVLKNASRAGEKIISLIEGILQWREE